VRIQPFNLRMLKDAVDNIISYPRSQGSELPCKPQVLMSPFVILINARVRALAQSREFLFANVAMEVQRPQEVRNILFVLVKLALKENQ